MILLQANEGLPNVADANPYGLAVYGILVAVLIWLLYRNEQKLNDLQAELKNRDNMLINITTESIKGLERATIALSPEINREREERIIEKIDKLNAEKTDLVINELRQIITDLKETISQYLK